MINGEWMGWVGLIPIASSLWMIVIGFKSGSIPVRNGDIHKAKEPALFWFTMVFLLTMLTLTVRWLVSWVTS